MKTSQWIAALVALVGVVFFVTFSINYIGQTTATEEETSKTEAGDMPTLNFPFRQYPLEIGNGLVYGAVEAEFRKPGYQDFWFANESDERIRVGLEKKSCKCQKVEIFIMHDGYTPPPARPVPPQSAALVIGSLGLDGYMGLLNELMMNRNLANEAESRFELDPNVPGSEGSVPPHRMGWVRMHWSGEKSGPLNLTAKLWMQHPDSGLTVDLERRANFLVPVLVIPDDRLVGTLRPDDLPRTLSFVVWSSTRPSFKITKVDVVRPAGLPPSADAFVVGKPEFLSPAGCAAAEQETRKFGARVLSGYRIPVTLLRTAPDGKTPFDLGNFRRTVEVHTDASEKPLPVAFKGTVKGDVQVYGTDESGAINFGSFRRGSEPERAVTIRSEVPGVELDLDKTRVPEYLRATLTEEPTLGGGGKAWKLLLRALPGAYGAFPRDDDPAYRDSAVYVRTAGPAPQSLRVAVKGDAVDR